MNLYVIEYKETDWEKILYFETEAYNASEAISLFKEEFWAKSLY
jgi:hypothetical protein